MKAFTAACDLLTHLQVCDWQEDAVLIYSWKNTAQVSKCTPPFPLRTHLKWHLTIYYAIMLAPLHSPAL